MKEKLVAVKDRLVTKLLKDGSEKPDPKPLSVPTGIRKPETIHEQIRRMIRTEASIAAMEQGQETFEEADDFEVGDDYDPLTPYEMDFDHESASLPDSEATSSDSASDSQATDFEQETVAAAPADTSADTA